MTDSHTPFDFSMQSVPDTWHAAAVEAPEADDHPMRRPRLLKVIPTLERADVITGTIAALAMSFVAGVAWWAFETRDHFSTPWLAIPLALLVATAVRLGAGRPDPDVRASLAVVFYLLTLFATIYMIERYDFVLTYGRAPDLSASENALIRDRLSQPETVVAWAMGLVLVVQSSYWMRRR